MLATHCMVVVTLSGSLLCSDSPSPHIPQNPFPSSNRGLVLVVWIMFGRVGADMALGHGWCTILLLLLGNNEKLPPVALDHRRPLQCCLKKDGSSSSMVFAEQQHGAGLFTSCKTFWNDLKYPVKHILVYLNSCAERDCQMLWLLWAYERSLGTLSTPPVNVVEEILLRVDIIGF